MPRLTNLDDDILKGIIFGFNILDHDVTTAHSKLLQLTGTQMFTLKQVKSLHEQIKRGLYKLDTANRLLLAENGVFRDHGMIELVQELRCQTLIPTVIQEVLKDVIGIELYDLHTVNDIHFHDICFYNKNALRGLMLCLKSQGVGENYDQLVEATKGDACRHLNQPVFSPTDLEELNKDFERGEYLEQQHDVKLWAAVRPYQIMESIVKHADFESR
ncbi:hypothetical protein CAEBREN_18106 [Caenorhabditis brenneri]|uniref:DUF38 domain-containing protein n=1 Tax=Caenorhabditis brenneri TaxID=135651 RepID=G0N8A1_CAEBE|nr:hypothetical protein CAEBREN_18106 [Caenorhabditis brenneri]